MSVTWRSSASLARSTCFTNRGIVIVVCWVGFALYLLTGGWKQERSTGVETKRRGRESVIDPKNHCQIRFCSPLVLPKNEILARLSFGLRRLRWEWGSLRNSRRMGVLGRDLKALQRVAEPSAVRGSFGFLRAVWSLACFSSHVMIQVRGRRRSWAKR